MASSQHEAGHEFYEALYPALGRKVVVELPSHPSSSTTIEPVAAFKGDVALFAISANNGYFKVPEIRAMLTFLLEHHNRVVVLVLQNPQIFNYLALGESRKKAQKRAKEYADQAVKYTASAMEAIVGAERVSIERWDGAVTSVEHNALYHEMKAKVDSFYDQVPRFREKAANAASDYLRPKLSNLGALLRKEDVDLSVQYVLSELAYVAAGPNLYKLHDAAPVSFTVVYHRFMDFFVSFLDGEFTGWPVPNVMYMTARAEPLDTREIIVPKKSTLE